MADKWSEWKRKTAIRRAIHAGLPPVVREVDDLYWWGRRTWNNTLRPKRIRQHVAWFIQRGRRGWSDSDVWSTDSYITRVLGEMIGELSRTTQSWPGGGSQWKTFEDWTSYLSDLSGRLLAWNDETFLEEEAFKTSEEAVREALDLIMAGYGNWWNLYGKWLKGNRE